ncbi:MAG: ATP-grasp domain-containing protein [Clostridiales bacterium]|nr:ATP-grasp domain-containing protein [Clostridiales bacterium]
MKHTNEKHCWLLYDRPDLAVNRDYAALMRTRGEACGLDIEAVTIQELSLGMNADGQPFLRRYGQDCKPDAVLSRMRFDWISEHLERMGIPVFNNSKVCRICNDKRRTHLFLSGLPMAETLFANDSAELSDLPAWPQVLKPALGHGGESVSLIQSDQEWAQSSERLKGRPALCQSVVKTPGRDLRVYVLFGRIIAGVMRTAHSGIVSNFKLGGDVQLHTLTEKETVLANAVIQRFEQAGAPLCMAGVDLLYNGDEPVISEVEDVVGSRMLYKVSDIDLADLYLQEIKKRLHM